MCLRSQALCMEMRVGCPAPVPPLPCPPPPGSWQPPAFSAPAALVQKPWGLPSPLLHCPHVHPDFSSFCGPGGEVAVLYARVLTVHLFCQKHKLPESVFSETGSASHPSVLSHNSSCFLFRHCFWGSGLHWKHKDDKPRPCSGRGARPTGKAFLCWFSMPVCVLSPPWKPRL